VLTERELWAAAVWVEDHHGDQALQFITERMTTLAEAGDAEGVIAWIGISDRYDKLQAGQRGPLPV
jgi:hypothetical protein